ncbi:hypothetical protein GC170_12940 [bacterium]|nr:hypothetical protein [bacterium]
MVIPKRSLIPVSLGLLAMLAHHSVLARKVRLSDYVVLRKPVSLGQEITNDAIAKVQLPGDEERLRKILVPWSQKHLVLMAVAQRNMFPDDVLFWQDTWRKENDTDGLEEDEKLVPLDLSGVIVETMLLMPGKLVWFEIAMDAEPSESPPVRRNGKDEDEEPSSEQWRSKGSGRNENGRPQVIRNLGPYRIVTVGAQKEAKVPEEKTEEKSANLRGSGRSITIPLKYRANGVPDEKTEKLLLAAREKRITRVVFEASKLSRDDEEEAEIEAETADDPS